MSMLIRKEELNIEGQGLVEVLVAIGIFVLGITASFTLFFGGQSLSADSANSELAIDFASEGAEAVRSIRDRNWNELTDGAHGLVFQNGEWMLGSSTVSDTKDIFTRTVVISAIDANTKQASTTISWQTGDRIQAMEVASRITRWSRPLVGGCPAGPLTGNWAAPRVLGSGDLGSGNEGTDIVTSLPYVYISGVASSASKPDIFVFNASNPLSPALIASLNIGAGGITALYLKGNYLYAASGNDTKDFIVFDISSPAGISEAASLNLAGNADGISVYGTGNTVYVGKAENGGGAELFVIDISTPTSPLLVTDIEIDEDVKDIVASSDNLYLATDDSGKEFYVYNIESPNSPAFLANYNINTGDGAASVYFQLAGNVLVGNDSNNFFILGATTTNQIYVRDSLNVGGEVRDIICVADNLAFLATGNSTKEFMIVNISDLDNVTEYASFNFPQMGTGIDFADNKIFMSVRSNDALRIITSQ